VFVFNLKIEYKHLPGPAGGKVALYRRKWNGNAAI